MEALLDYRLDNAGSSTLYNLMGLHSLLVFICRCSNFTLDTLTGLQGLLRRFLYFLYVNDVRISHETHIHASTASYRDNFTFVYVYRVLRYRKGTTGPPWLHMWTTLLSTLLIACGPGCAQNPSGSCHVQKNVPLRGIEPGSLSQSLHLYEMINIKFRNISRQYVDEIKINNNKYMVKRENNGEY
jgi:hypothetical protein